MLTAMKGTPFYEETKETFDLLSTVVPEVNISGLEIEDKKKENWFLKRIIFLDRQKSKINKDVWKILRKALKNNYVISFFYHSSLTYSRKHVFQPWQLFFDGNYWQIVGYDYSHKDVKYGFCFFVGLLEKVEIYKEANGNILTFDMPKDFDFNTKNHTFGAYQTNETKVYKIKLSNQIARLVFMLEEDFGEDCKRERIDNEPESILLSFKSNQIRPIMKWCLSWGTDAIPIEPPELVENWKKSIDELKKIADNV